jgi:hypothetical protein
MREASTLTLIVMLAMVDVIAIVGLCVLRSDVIDNHCNTQAMLAKEDMLEECSFARALQYFS